MIVLLWALVTLVAVNAGGGGVAVAIMGWVLIVGQTWVERNRRRHPTAAMVWSSGWSLGAGVLLIGLAVLRTEGWEALVPGALGAWLISLRVALIAAWLRTSDHEGSAG